MKLFFLCSCVFLSFQLMAEEKMPNILCSFHVKNKATDESYWTDAIRPEMNASTHSFEYLPKVGFKAELYKYCTSSAGCYDGGYYGLNVGISRDGYEALVNEEIVESSDWYESSKVKFRTDDGLEIFGSCFKVTEEE